MKDLTTKLDVTFSLPAVFAENINHAAVAKVNDFLPELEAKTRAFDRQNSQHTLSMMTLTMLNGQSPMRMMRQIMAETEKRKMALAEAKTFPSIPLKVTLNEYIELSKFYSTEKSHGFINGILDQLFTKLKESGAIKKTGRGLI